MEDVADLDAARRHPRVAGQRLEHLRLVLLRGRRIARGPDIDDSLHRVGIVEVHVGLGNLEVEIVAVAIDLALAGGGEDDELVAQIAADRPGVGDHRDGAQTHPRKGAQIGDEHAIVGMPRAGIIEIEGIGVLHQEFARAHGAESRPHLVAKLPLQVIEIEREILVGAHIGAEDLGDHLLVGRTVEHLALVAVLDAQHLLAVVVVAAALAPQLGRLDGRHQHLDRAGAVLLLAHDAADLLQHAKAEREKRVDARGLLANHSGAQHQPVRNDLCLLGSFTQDRQKITGQSHGLRVIPLKTRSQ